MPGTSEIIRERLGHRLVKTAVGLSLDQDEMAQRLAAAPSHPAANDITRRVMAVTGGLAALALALATRLLSGARRGRARRLVPRRRIRGDLAG